MTTARPRRKESVSWLVRWYAEPTPAVKPVFARRTIGNAHEPGEAGQTLPGQVAGVCMICPPAACASHERIRKRDKFCPIPFSYTERPQERDPTHVTPSQAQLSHEPGLSQHRRPDTPSHPDRRRGGANHAADAAADANAHAWATHGGWLSARLGASRLQSLHVSTAGLAAASWLAGRISVSAAADAWLSAGLPGHATWISAAAGGPGGLPRCRGSGGSACCGGCGA